MRNVEALHAVRRILEAEITAELLDSAERLRVRLPDTCGLVGKKLFGVAGRHRDDVMLRAALRNEQLHLHALLLCQPCFEQ